MAADFDLLATHDLVESAIHDEHEDEKLLIWKKLSAEGFQPSARTVSRCIISMNIVIVDGCRATRVFQSDMALLLLEAWKLGR